MSDAMVGAIAGVMLLLPAGIAVVAYGLVNQKSRGEKQLSIWQSCAFVSLWLVAMGGFVGLGIEGQNHFHKEFAGWYFACGGILNACGAIALMFAVTGND